MKEDNYMTILENQIERLNRLELKLEEIISHPNRSLLDVIMIDYIILLRDTIEEEIQISRIVHNSRNEDIINNQIEYNNKRLSETEPEIQNIYNLINR